VLEGAIDILEEIKGKTSEVILSRTADWFGVAVL
jgi:hypothetical protein